MNKIFFIAIVIFLLACGGGGGGGSSSSHGVRVFHGLLDVETLSLFAPAEENSARVDFAGVSSFRSLAEGTQAVPIYRLGQNASPAFNPSVEIASGGRYSVLTYGNTSNFGLNSTVLNDALVDVSSNQVAVRLLHALIGASAITGTADATALSAVSFGGGSEYQLLDLPAGGSLTFTFKRQADQRTVASQSIVLESGKSYTFLLTGEVDLFVTLKSFLDS